MNSKNSRLSLLEEVASLYYEDGLKQEDIAERFYISRTQVSRMLNQAIQQGIVEIKVHHRVNRNYDLENRIASRYGLKDVVLLNARQQTADTIQKGVSLLAAQYVNDCLKKDITLGVSWGGSVYATVDALKEDKKKSIEVVQVMGTPDTSNPAGNTHELIGRLASVYNTSSYYLSAPLYIDDDYVRGTIVSDMQVAKTLEMARNADMILTGVGTLSAVQSTNAWLGYMSDTMLQEIRSLGGVGCICARFYNAEGKVLDCRWNRNCVGILLKDLRRIDDVIAVATGSQKKEAIRGALKGGYVKILISDSETAMELL